MFLCYLHVLKVGLKCKKFVQALHQKISGPNSESPAVCDYFSYRLSSQGCPAVIHMHVW